MTNVTDVHRHLAQVTLEQVLHGCIIKEIADLGAGAFPTLGLPDALLSGHIVMVLFPAPAAAPAFTPAQDENGPSAGALDAESPESKNKIKRIAQIFWSRNNVFLTDLQHQARNCIHFL